MNVSLALNNINNSNTNTNNTSDEVYDLGSEKVQVVTFVNEGESNDMNAPEVSTSPVQSMLDMTTREQKVHGIKDFLEREFQIDSFNWALSDAVDTILKTYRFPDVLLNIPAISAKLRGFYGFRAGVELRVLVNKQPFQAGNLLISYLPGAKYNAFKVEQHKASACTRSGAPRTNLDLMTATQAVLQVPYASPFVYFNLLTQEGTIGDFNISVYSALSDIAANGSVSITVFARFIDVDPQFPTGAPPTFSGRFSKLYNMFINALNKLDMESITNIRKEFVNVEKRLRAQAGDEVSIINIKQRALPNMTNTNQDNNAHVMSLQTDYVIPPANMGQTSNADMNFGNMLSIPCLHDRFSWTKTDAAQANLWSKSVAPQVAYKTNADTSIEADYIYFLSELANLWHGSIIYSFRVVKTMFHSGRLRFTFSPGNASLTTLDRNSCYTTVVDFKVNNEFEFVVPYPQVWPLTDVKGSRSSIGTIIVDVVNPLVAPETVASSIEIIVERRAGPDFRFSLPGTINKVPLNPLKPAAGTNTSRTPAHPPPSRIPILQPIAGPSGINVPNTPNVPSSVVTGAVAAVATALAANKPRPRRSLDNSRYEIILEDEVPLIEASGGLKPTLVIDEHAHEPIVLLSDLRPGELREVKPLLAQMADEVPSQDSARLGDIPIQYVRPQPSKVADDLCIGYDMDHVSAMTQRSTLFKFLTVESVYLRNLSGEVITLTPTPANPINATSTATGPGIISINTNLVTLRAGKYLYVQRYTGTGFVNTTAPTLSVGTITSIGVAGSTTASIETYLLDLPSDGTLTVGILTATTMDGAQFRFAPYDLAAASIGFPVHYNPHYFGCAYYVDNDNVNYTTSDNLSYFASVFAFYRGSINTRLTLEDASYTVILDPTNAIDTLAKTTGADGGTPLTPITRLLASNTMNQVIVPNVEGMGEFTTPYYSNTFHMYVSPQGEMDVLDARNNFQLPLTNSLIIPRPDASPRNFAIYRAAGKDFQFSYLTGPPILYPFSALSAQMADEDEVEGKKQSNSLAKKIGKVVGTVACIIADILLNPKCMQGVAILNLGFLISHLL